MPEPTPAEMELNFKGFSEPEAAYGVSSERVTGAGCMAVAFAVSGLCLAALFFSVEPGRGAKAPWVGPVIGVVLGGGSIGLAVWIVRRIAAFKSQRVLLYPEGIVVWRNGEPVAYEWKEIASVSRKREDPGPRNRALVLLAMAGKELEVVIKFEDDSPLVLNGMLVGLDELVAEIKERLRRAPPPPPPPPWSAGAKGTASGTDDNPFGNLF